MNRKRYVQKLKKFFAGLLVYLVLIFLAVSVYEYLKDMNKKHYYILTADVKKTDGLKDDDLVRLSGIDVGKISELRLKENFSVEIYMRINNDVFIPDDSSIAIYTDGLMGDKYITIIPGGSNDYMLDGDVFEFAQDSVNISEMIQIGLEQYEVKDKK